MTNILELKDRRGRIIRLSDKHWARILEHPEMSNREGFLITAFYTNKIVGKNE